MTDDALIRSPWQADDHEDKQVRTGTDLQTGDDTVGQRIDFGCEFCADDQNGCTATPLRSGVTRPGR